MKRWPARRLVPLVLLTSFLGGCASDPPPPCPPVSILGDAASITNFAPRGTDLIDVTYRATIEQVGRSCEYNGERDTVTSTTAVRLVATRGPAAQNDQETFVFFVAIVDKDQNILARERFESSFEFRDNQRQAGAVEEIEQVIPIRPGLRGLDYEILVGFELSPEQLEYNRQERQRRTGLPRLPGS